MEVKDTPDPDLREAVLEGREVAITGQLASMPRDQAIQRIRAAGGTYVATPGPGTALLVIGEAGPPLGEDGKLTEPLRRARDLRAGGAPLRLLREGAWLELLGTSGDDVDLERLFTTAQLARILGEPLGRIRAWVRHGLIVPVKTVRRLHFFDFPQVATARALARLAAEGVTPARLRRSLEQLEAWLPGGATSLAQLEALERGGPLFVRTPDGDLAETTGQLRLDFEEEDPSAETEPGPTSGEFWFQRGLRLEDAEQHEQATQAYAKALDPKAPRAEVAFNLGNCLQVLGRHEDACQAFALATEVDGEYVEAWNNLGIALGDLGRTEEAFDAFRDALGIDPEYADAHFNLAEALAAEGLTDEARRHWTAYLEFDPDSTWADEVRARLRRTR